MNDLWETLKVYIGIGLGFILIVAVIAGILAFTAPSSSSGSSSSSDSLTCKVCGRSFSDSTNKKSIRSTNMCSQCYKNFTYAKGMKYNNYDQHFVCNDSQALSGLNELSFEDINAPECFDPVNIL